MVLTSIIKLNSLREQPTTTSVTKAYVDAKASESSIEPPFIGAVYNFLQ